MNQSKHYPRANSTPLLHALAGVVENAQIFEIYCSVLGCFEEQKKKMYKLWFTLCISQLNACVTWLSCDAFKQRRRTEFRLQILVLRCDSVYIQATVRNLPPPRSSLLQMRWLELSSLWPWMNHFRYVYYRKQGYRRISPGSICFVSAFIKHSAHLSALLDYLFTAVSLALSAISV